MKAGDHVKRVDVDAAELVTIGPDHPAWTDPMKLAGVDGAFVRLDPPANIDDEDVKRLHAMVVEEGAVAVKVLPTRRNAVAAEYAAPKQVAHTSARGLIEGMVAEARSHDREALAAVVDDAMKEAGL
jgi:hypothetical protein